MSNHLVKILIDDDGEYRSEIVDNELVPNPYWCLVDPCNPNGAATLCTSEFFGEGESSVVYEEKTVQRGGITCPACIKKIKIYKAVKL